MIRTYLPGRQGISAEQESASALDAIKALHRLMRDEQPVQLCIVNGDHEELIELPPTAVEPLMNILSAILAKRSITLTRDRDELTTERAAEILNVSHPYLIKLLDEGEIPFHRVGPHRRVRLEDVIDYKEASYRAREAILAQLVAESQEMGLYD